MFSLPYKLSEEYQGITLMIFHPTGIDKRSLFVCNNPSPCKVSMVLSGDLVAPLTVSAAPEVCPTGPHVKEA